MTFRRFKRILSSCIFVVAVPSVYMTYCDAIFRPFVRTDQPYLGYADTYYVDDLPDGEYKYLSDSSNHRTVHAPEIHRHHFDVVVIGGGFAGLHTALRLGEKGQRVLVIEKGRVGSGASGMSAGVVVPAFEPRPEALNSRTPFSRFLAERTDARDALFQNCCDALQRMRDIIWYYNIECAFEDSGTLLIKHTAKSPKEYIKDDNLNDLATLRSSTFGIKTSMASKDFLYQTAQEYQAAPPKKNVHPGKSPDVKILGQTLEPPSYDADPVKTRSPVIPVLGQDVRLSVKDESIRWAYHAQRNFSVNSFQFCVGLADTIERFAGCGVVEKSEAVEVQDVRASDPLYPLMLRVRCEGSVGNHYVKARHVVCCTNAVPWWFSAWHSLQNIAIYSSILVTKPFPKGKLDEALTTYANIVDNEAGAVFRRLPGDRLLWSGNVNTRPHSTEQLSGHEDLYLQQIEAAFPVLRGWISTESLWQGQSFSGQAPLCPLVGRTRTPRLWVNAGHYCNGLTSACAAGVVVADAILEGYHTEDINDLRPIPSKLKAWEHCRPWAPIIAPAKQLWAAYVAPRYVSVQSN